MLYLDILNKKQIKVLEKLDFLDDQVYLAGGTALALQMGHRTSLDFDFYSKVDFKQDILISEFQKRFNNMTVENIARGTLILTIDEINFSLFHYPYELISKFVVLKHTKMASIEDASAMKFLAVAMRGKRRDFIDVYYLLKQFKLNELLGFVKKKYPTFEELMILKGLIFFEDAEDEDISRGIKIFDKDFSWELAKKTITEEVTKYQLSMIDH
ncbi:MAG: nucleotidyl transferase AbiEii/AbiGii toxin family protein [Patescibacteria group bacterium]